ncbi:hypothetical protein BC834DRAFT_523090 [Gloeopeniophorella convolvens]|nr:hypothetical protein BC834DRAFT_523090 [Gloeopeniophorella convolvens]
MTVTKLVSLPTELLVNILEYCDTPAIVACILTCSRLKYIVDHTSTLRYVVDLAANGMYDRGSNVSIAHRQQRLEAYLTAWRDLSWSESGSSSDFTGRSWHGLHVFGNILAYQSEKLPGYALTLQRLPSKLRAVNSERWCIETPSWAFQLDIDDAQDLCIYRIPQSPEFHIVTLSSGLAHPSNTTQGLVTLDDDVTLVQHNDLRIHRESFAFVAHDSDKYRSTVFVFDWKHGERLARVVSSGSDLWMIYSHNAIFPYNAIGSSILPRRF